MQCERGPRPYRKEWFTIAMIQSALLQEGYGVWVHMWVASQNPLIVKADYSTIFGEMGKWMGGGRGTGACQYSSSALRLDINSL